MRVIVGCALTACMAAAGVCCAEYLIGSPEMTPSSVDSNGAVREDWGTVALRIEAPSGAQPVPQEYSVSPVPTVVTQSAAGAVTLTQTVYRAPIWPAGVDVLTARIQNAGAAEAPARMLVAIPNEMAMGEALGVMGGRPVLALPQNAKAIRPMKPWGCTGGVVPMPGWATPQGECDPAFRNISAGMGGVPIQYRFAAPNREKRTVVLGFCESFHSQAGQRPLEIVVEGAPKGEVDPLVAWGRHVPGCLKFDASDENGDGYLDVQINPHPKAVDRNPILNVIWIFKPGTAVDLDAVKLGKKSAETEVYVDVGGAKDQTLYENGPFAYEWKLAPGQAQELTFLVAGPEGSVPNPKDSTWTDEKLNKAAMDVWRDWFAQGKNLLEPNAEPQRKALAQIILCRAQGGGFFLALPQPGKFAEFSNAKAQRMIETLDAAGLHGEAERLLRVYWAKPAPAPFAAFSQQDSGEWQDAVKDPAASAHALLALASHAMVGATRAWVDEVRPAMAAGAAWLEKPDVQARLTPEAKKTAEAAIQRFSQVPK